ncbi:type II toxin-antitoxin system RelE/ParE family toxin [Thermodesulfovibrionales bacterium]|nr:type II toxin-antitoxin system RelE/ParE family toxin [Thermodesulfovibrionales bacterium]
MKYKVTIHKRVAKHSMKLPEDKKEVVKGALEKLRNGEFRELKAKNMWGEWEGYKRFRIGKIRVIFCLDQKEKTIYVDYIGSRGDIYKK